MGLNLAFGLANKAKYCPLQFAKTRKYFPKNVRCWRWNDKIVSLCYSENHCSRWCARLTYVRGLRYWCANDQLNEGEQRDLPHRDHPWQGKRTISMNLIDNHQRKRLSQQSCKSKVSRLTSKFTNALWPSSHLTLPSWFTSLMQWVHNNQATYTYLCLMIGVTGISKHKYLPPNIECTVSIISRNSTCLGK